MGLRLAKTSSASVCVQLICEFVTMRVAHIYIILTTVASFLSPWFPHFPHFPPCTFWFEITPQHTSVPPQTSWGCVGACQGALCRWNRTSAPALSEPRATERCIPHLPLGRTASNQHNPGGPPQPKRWQLVANGGAAHKPRVGDVL